jgi:protein-tyrosine-phosphatase
MIVAMYGKAVNIAAAIFALLIATACATTQIQGAAPTASVLFVCEHGNVKSLMAMSYFNQIAQERKLPFVAISRGTDPNSTTVPKAIIDGLIVDGLDTSEFRPTKVSASDVASAHRVITIGVTLPEDVLATKVSPESWDDIPPASLDFQASSGSIKAHVQELINQLRAMRN